ncbi:Polyamine transporter 3 [Tolypocladium capitatum]|uniref:Polyamine transporter 3 n=1 Tax=Tolypocladium capitatum TaxID=45235 RepID=A0A2K3Q9D2_9HYPO|nr:Polyamine transporter 3 [Tolypocladium capitatum]
MARSDSSETVTDVSGREPGCLGTIVMAACPGGRKGESCLSDRIQQLDEPDAQQRPRTAVSVPFTTSGPGLGVETNQVVVGWQVNDPENPYHWPMLNPIQEELRHLPHVNAHFHGLPQLPHRRLRNLRHLLLPLPPRRRPPLATSRMFATLGISGACALLGGLGAGMCLTPFIFTWKGSSIRSRSRFCLALKERREAIQRKVEEDRQKIERAARREKVQDMA